MCKLETCKDKEFSWPILRRVASDESASKAALAKPQKLIVLDYITVNVVASEISVIGVELNVNLLFVDQLDKECTLNKICSQTKKVTYFDFI